LDAVLTKVASALHFLFKSSCSHRAAALSLLSERKRIHLLAADGGAVKCPDCGDPCATSGSYLFDCARCGSSFFTVSKDYFVEGYSKGSGPPISYLPSA
jgi:Zn finger protein HypA/HybF involved in hydrogenase expression